MPTVTENERYRRIQRKRKRIIKNAIYILIMLVVSIVTILVVLNKVPSSANENHHADISNLSEEQTHSIDKSDWKLALVNADNPLPDDYEPELTQLSGGKYFDSRAVKYLNEMIYAANEDGLDLMICSAYRSVDYQTQLFNEQIASQQSANGYSYDEAVQAAATVVAYPGTSEHNLGLAADIVTPEYQRLDSGYGDTAEANWLKENCAKFGFILRYPQNKEDTTGIIFEPWHFRYVGEEAATYIMENELCLEEYLELAN